MKEMLISTIKNPNGKKVRRGKPRLKKRTCSEIAYQAVALILMCLSLPALYIQSFSLIFALRQLTVQEILDDHQHQWKLIAENIFLALILTAKMAQISPSITFLDRYWGIGLYAFFAGNLNTIENY